MATVALSNRLLHIPRAATLTINARIQALKKNGADIINLSAGEPDFPTPERICLAAKRALDQGMTRYTDVQGTLSLREAIRWRIKKDYHFEPSLESIIVGNGGKQCLYNLFQALLNEGDEVLIPAPYWLTYPPQVVLAHGTPVIVPTFARDNFQLTLESLEKFRTPRTVAIVLNSPNNPTGTTYRRDVLEMIANFSEQHNLLIITDDLYYQLRFSNDPFFSVTMLSPEIQQRTVIVGGVSKAYAMTGWRIGYAIGPAAVISAMAKVQGQTTSNPCSISQYAAEEALSGDKDDREVIAMARAFQSRRDLIINCLNHLPNLECPVPDGAFYVFPRLCPWYGFQTPQGERITGSISMGEYLVNEVGLAGVPGIEFGDDDHLRFSYSCCDEQITDGIQRLGVALSRLTP